MVDWAAWKAEKFSRNPLGLPQDLRRLLHWHEYNTIALFLPVGYALGVIHGLDFGDAIGNMNTALTVATLNTTTAAAADLSAAEAKELYWPAIERTSNLIFAAIGAGFAAIAGTTFVYGRKRRQYKRQHGLTGNSPEARARRGDDDPDHEPQSNLGGN